MAKKSKDIELAQAKQALKSAKLVNAKQELELLQAEAAMRMTQQAVSLSTSGDYLAVAKFTSNDVGKAIIDGATKNVASIFATQLSHNKAVAAEASANAQLASAYARKMVKDLAPTS